MWLLDGVYAPSFSARVHIDVEVLGASVHVVDQGLGCHLINYLREFEANPNHRNIEWDFLILWKDGRAVDGILTLSPGGGPHDP